MKKLALLLILFAITGCEPSQNTSELHTNFVHVVYFWLNNPDSLSDRQEFETQVKGFLESSKYAKTNFLGVPAMTKRDVVDNSYTYCAIISFNSKEEQDSYQKEQAHLDFVKEASHLWRKVQVYDSLHLE